MRKTSKLLKRKKRDTDDETLQYLDKEIQKKGRNHILPIDRYTLMETYERLTLQQALRYKWSKAVILRLIDVGGREFVMEKSRGGEHVLHTACQNKAPFDVISKLVEIGGKELFTEKYRVGNMVLYTVHENQPLIKLISKPINVKDREIVMERSSCRQTMLQSTCRRSYQALIQVLLKLIEIGGRDLSIKRSLNRDTVLYTVYKNNASIEVTSKLTEVVVMKECDE